MEVEPRDCIKQYLNRLKREKQVRQDKRIINKSVYVALGIDTEGKKDILGLWISKNEGAKFWLDNLTENRGMSDMLIACTDNLTGMAEAISAVCPIYQASTEDQDVLALESFEDKMGCKISSNCQILVR